MALFLLNLQTNVYIKAYVFRKCFVLILSKWSVIYSGPAFIMYAHIDHILFKNIWNFSLRMASSDRNMSENLNYCHITHNY